MSAMKNKVPGLAGEPMVKDGVSELLTLDMGAGNIFTGSVFVMAVG
jgi:hypothetical protein